MDFLKINNDAFEFIKTCNALSMYPIVKERYKSKKMHIFKYFKFGQKYDKGTIHCLTEGKLYFGKADIFNDPNEFKNLELSDMCRQQLVKNADFNFKKLIIENFRFCCFTLVPPDLLTDEFKEIYLNNGNGFWIEYEVQDEDILYPVIYSNEMIYFDNPAKLFLKMAKTPKNDELFLEVIKIFASIKDLNGNDINKINRIWYNEFEVRIFNPKEYCSNQELKLKPIYIGFGNNITSNDKKIIEEAYLNGNL